MNENKIKGLTTELQCQAYLTQLGYNISIPLGEDCRYDLILDVEGILLRVQVKTARENENKTGITIPCRTIQSNTVKHTVNYYSKEQIDYFATYYNNKCYLIKVEECSTQKTLSFTKKQVNQTMPCFIEDYEAEKVIERIINNEDVIEIKNAVIYQYDLRNNLLDTFESASDAARKVFNDISKNGHISQCVNGTRKTAYGYVWKKELIKG